MGKRKNRVDFWGDCFWQSSNYNQRMFNKWLGQLTALAMNRFRWTGLPDYCDERFLEFALHKNGVATISHAKETPDVWQSLFAIPTSTFDVYGIPVKWQAQGFNETNYDVDDSNGELVFYSQSRLNPWNALEMFARRLAHYDRTEDINLTHQHMPTIWIAPEEKRLELINIVKQAYGGEPAVLGNKWLGDIADNVRQIDTGVPFIGEDINRGRQNCLHEAMTFLGIPHLAFEKGERMIEDEVTANSSPTNLMLLDCLQARRSAADRLNKRFGLDIHVYFNQDIESLNYNYVNNIEAQAQDGLLTGGADDGGDAA